MKKNSKLFLQQNEFLPQLNLYMVFVESSRPILFACQDAENNPYICSCHCSNAQKSEWIVAPTSYEQLLQLLTNQISIRDIFTSKTEEAFIVTKLAGNQDSTIIPCHIDAMDQNILPTAGYYMDAEEDEYSEEIKELQQQIKASEAFTNIYDRHEYQMILKNYCFSIASISASIISSKDCYNHYICYPVR